MWGSIQNSFITSSLPLVRQNCTPDYFVYRRTTLSALFDQTVVRVLANEEGVTDELFRFGFQRIISLQLDYTRLHLISRINSAGLRGRYDTISGQLIAF
jgi:hypothetical protein